MNKEKEIMDLKMEEIVAENDGDFEETMDVDFIAVQISALEILKQNCKKLTKKQLKVLKEKINNAHDIYSMFLIIDLIKLFLKIKENKENE